MKNIKYIAAAFLFSGMVYAQNIDINAMPKPGPTPAINIAKPNSFKLKNGLTVLVVENNKLPRVNIQLTIDRPYIYEGNIVGVGEIMADQLGTGTTKLSKEEFNKKIDFLGAYLSFSSEGAGANTLSKYSTQVISLMADAVVNPKFSAEEVNKSKERTIEGLKTKEKDKKSENPQLIFESLNSTGLSLTQADLIRNYLLMNSEYEKQTVLYKNFWLKIEIELTNKKISDFIRDFLTMKTGKIANKNKVYDDFKEYMRIQKELNEEAVLEELVTYSKYYNWFLNANSNNEKLNEKLKHFKYLKNTTVYPLLLSIFEDTYYYKKFDEDKLLKIIDLLISYIFRRTICGYKTSSINKVFASIPKKILENQNEKDIYFKIEKNLMERRLETIFPRDEEFKVNFIKYNFEKNKELLRYTLKELEQKVSNNVINDTSNLNIEYIMPENLNSEWKLELGEKKFENTHLEYLGTIGNSSLIENDLLRYNKNFKTKKEFYQKSNIEITRNINNYQVWTDNEIKNRAEQLYEKSKEIWSIPAGYKIQKLNNIEYGKEYLLNSSINVTGEKPDKLIIDGIPYPVKSWKGLLEKLCIELYNLDSDIFKELIYNPNFQTKERVILSNSISKLRQPIEISNDLYIESNLNANAILSYADIIAANFELSDEIYFVLKRK